jgi:DHA1 family bicyclomycin/chloramphenicol resistance-like MFS transporter
MPPASPHLPPPSRPHPESLTIGALLTVLVALGQISISLYVPSMPSLVAELGTSAERVSLTLSLFLAGFAMAQLVYGPLSDRFGRRPVLLCGIVLYLVASLICAMATTIETLIAARVVQGMGACVGPVLGRAIVRDVYGRERAAQVFAYIGLAFAISPAVTPIIGGYMQIWFGWRANFYLLTALGILVLWAVWLLLSETNRQPDPGALCPTVMARNYVRMLGTPEYVGYMLSIVFVFAGLMAYVVVAPFVFIDTIGLTPDQFGLVNMFNVVGFFAGTLAAGRLTLRVGIERMVGIGIVLCFLGGAAMAGTALAGPPGIAAIVWPLLVFTAGMGIVFPNAMAGAMGPFPRATGTASALLGFFQMGFAATVSALAGWVSHETHLFMGLIITGASAVGLVGFTVLVGWRRLAA